MTNINAEFLNILKSDNTDEDKYNTFLELLPKIKKCAKCKKYLLKTQFKQGYCIPCKAEYTKKFIQKKAKEKTRHCKICNTTKESSEFYTSSLYRCKECVKDKQSDYSMKYYYTKGRDRRKKITKFYLDNCEDVKNERTE